MKNDAFRGVCLILLVAGMTIKFKELISPFGILMWIVSSAIPYLAILILFGLFLHHAQFFQNSTSRWSHMMCFVGKRTLDIYFIHYFFLTSMPYLSTWISDNMTLQILSGTAFAIPIMGVSLLIGELIRTSSFMSRFLLGAKK